MRLALLVLASSALVALSVGIARAEPPAVDASAVPTAVATDIPVAPFVSFSHRGYLRFRGEAYGQAHLHDGARPGNLVSGMMPPLGRTTTNQGLVGGSGDADFIAGGNMRLRYEPKLTIDEVFSLQAQIDVFDNLVLGSTPAWQVGYGEAPLGFFADGQAPPSAGRNSLEDGIRVRQVWMSWELFHVLEVELGRMPFQWGAGIFANDGSCIDCNHGDIVDRMRFTVGSFDLGTPGFDSLSVSFAWDFPGEGAIFGSRFDYPTGTGGAVLGGGPAGFFGQPYDATQLDDVSQYVVVVENRARSIAAKRERQRRLEVERVPVVEWGWLNAFRTQDYATDLEEAVSDEGICGSRAPNHGPLSDPRLEVPFDCIRLFRRDAFTWTTDLWLRLDWWPSRNERFSFEVELVGVLFGRMGQTGSGLNEDSSKDIWSAGGVVRSTYGRDRLTFGLELGAASGDPDAQYFGVRDGSNAVVPTSEALTDVGRAIRADPTYTQFAFNRDYLVDLILFREVIGAVTNTIYTKPSVQYDFLDLAGFTVGGKLSVLYAAAMFPEATPGNGRHLGVETDAQLYVQAAPHFLGILEGGLLVPLDAFHVPSLPTPDLAWTVRLRLNLMF